MDFEPKLIVFCCNWCSYNAADLAGSSRMEYPPGVRIIRVMCTGMVHPDLLLSGLNQGADGMMILGCALGSCHYKDGNHKALARAEMISDILEDFGLEPERFQFGWLSSTEPATFVELVTKMSRQIQRLGPNTSRYRQPPATSSNEVN